MAQHPHDRITAVYILTGAAWILFSDALLLDGLGLDDALIPGLSILKGLAFVAVTGSVLYLHLRHAFSIRLALERDLTRQVEQVTAAQAALQESEARFRQLAENIREVFYLNDHSKQAMLYISPAYEAIWGRSRASLYADATAFIEAVHPDDRAEVIASFAQQREGREVEVNYRIIRPDHSLRWIRSRAFPVFNAEGQLYRIAGIAEDVTERVKVRSQLKRLAQRLVHVLDDERSRIARELHDQVGQQLTGLGINVGIIAMHCGPDHPAAPVIDDTTTLISGIIERIRGIITDLRPLILDDMGLLPGLSWYADRFSKRTGIVVDLQDNLQGPSISPTIDNTLYQIAQEALTNIAKHAQATHAWITLEADEQRLRMRVRDNGHGFDKDAVLAGDPTGSWGLQIMHERIQALIGASLDIDSEPGAGTTITVEVAL